MELRPSTTSLALAEDFAIARGSRTSQEVVRVEVEHDGLVGRGEAAPIYYRGETVRSALAFLSDVVPGRIGEDPFALEGIGRAVWADGAEAAARAALDAALHDWIGRRLGVPLWRLFAREPEERLDLGDLGSRACLIPAMRAGHDGGGPLDGVGAGVSGRAGFSAAYQGIRQL